MSSLQVHLTVGHSPSMPHLPCTLDPQMRVFYQHNLDPFDSALSMTDLLRAAGNFLSLARSSLSWARRFFAGDRFPRPERRSSKREREDRKEVEAVPKSAQRAERQAREEGGEGGRSTPPPAAEERVGRTREMGRRAAEQARERFQKACQEKREETPTGSAAPPRTYGLRLAISLSLAPSRKPRGARVGGELSLGTAAGSGGGAGRACPGGWFRGTLRFQLPLGRTSAGERRGREGR